MKSPARSIQSPTEETPREWIISRLPWILTMEAILVALICYPLRLEQDWLGRMVNQWKQTARDSAWSRFCIEQFEAMFSFYYSPLVFKGTLAAICVVGAASVYLAISFIRPLAGPEKTETYKRSRWEFAFFVAFLSWCGVSAFWSPTPGLAREAILWLVTLGGFIFLMLKRGVTFDEARQVGVLLILIGFAVGVVCLLQATEAFHGIIFKYLLKFDDEQRRNIYGSLIGHNSAVGLYMMMTSFPALALAVNARTVYSRLVYVGYIGLALMCALVTQSRSTWVFGPLLGAAFIVVASRQRSKDWPWRVVFYVAGLMGLGLISQTLKTEWNPFYIKESPLAKRLSGLATTGYTGDARMRLFVCSLPLIAQKPLFGHGLYSYAYVYPKAQGEYFKANPDSKLGRTVFRSNIAHNEYLQTWVEQGFIGFALMLLALGEIFWRASGRLSALDPAPRLLGTAFGFSVLAYCLDSLVNFPMHVPQLVIAWMACLAPFAAIKTRIAPWAAPIQEGGGTLIERGKRQNEFRTDHVARLTLALATILAIPFVTYPFARAHQADIDYCYGESYMNTLRADAVKMDPKIRESFFAEARAHLSRALIRQPTHDTARYTLGEMYYLHGYYLALDERRAAQGSPMLSAPALAEIKAGIETIEQSIGSLRYHNPYMTLALAHELIRAISTDPAEQAHSAAEYRKNLEEALFYCPTLTQAAILLDRLLSADADPDRNRILRLRQMIYRHDPFKFKMFYEREYHQRLQEQQYAAAMEGAESLIEVDSERPAHLIFALEANLYAGRVARVLEIVKRLKAVKGDPKEFSSPPIYSSYGLLYEALLQGDWTGALNTLSNQHADLPRNIALLAAVEEYARAKAGVTGLPSRFKKPPGFSDEMWSRLRADQKPVALYYWIRDLAGAQEAFEARLAMPGLGPDAKFWTDYAYLSRELGHAAKVEECVRKIRELNPKAPALGVFVAPNA